MAKRQHSKKAPVWLADQGAKPGKLQAKPERKALATEKKPADIKGAIHGNGAKPVTVGAYSEAAPQKMLDRIKRAEHPWGLRIAAGRLLRAIADLSSIKHLRRGQIEHLRTLLVFEIQTFEKLCHRAGFDRRHVVGASYCLCAASDEEARHTPWGSGGKDGTGAWSQRSLITQFHSGRDGGIRVYQLLARLVGGPDANLPLIHLIYVIISVGFMGRYHVEGDGEREHQLLYEKLYAIVKARVRPLPRELSPSLHVATERNLKPISCVPVWLTAVIGLVIASGIYAYFQSKLHKAQEAVLQTVEAINQMVSTPPPLPAPDAPESRASGL